MADALCLGEILVDWVCTSPGAELDRAESFTKAPGGAPANVAVALARQGIKTGFLGRVSTDAFGQWLKSILESEGIDTAGTIVDPEAHTRMAYVVTTVTGDRKLAEFSNIACADAKLCPQDLKPAMFEAAQLLHFGSISLISAPAREATLRAVELAQENKLLISYDPNVRIGLWPSADRCRGAILETLKYADLVKINLDELEFLTGSRNFDAAESLRKDHAVPLLIVTLDSQGAYLSSEMGSKEVPGFQVDFVEATGAGDGFVSGVIVGLLAEVKDVANRRAAVQNLSLERLSEIVRGANAVGALACMKAGAIPAMPTSAEIKKFLSAMQVQASS